MGAVAIIPARGGSKRIPRKNIREFLGLPIVAYSIRAAVASGCFDTVLVSTDDEEIAAVSRRYGAEVPFLRSATTAGDYATTAEVLLEVLRELEVRGARFHDACCIYPTAPFLEGRRIREAYDRMTAAGALSLMSIVRFDYPIQRALTFRDGRTSFWRPEHRETRSQDLEPMFHDAGQMYWFNVDQCLATGEFLSADCLGFELGPMEVQDIDTEHDWTVAELKYRLLKDQEYNNEGKQ